MKVPNRRLFDGDLALVLVLFRLRGELGGGSASYSPEGRSAMVRVFILWQKPSAFYPLQEPFTTVMVGQFSLVSQPELSFPTYTQL